MINLVRVCPHCATVCVATTQLCTRCGTNIQGVRLVSLSALLDAERRPIREPRVPGSDLPRDAD
jgi:hypothetical protein